MAVLYICDIAQDYYLFNKVAVADVAQAFGERLWRPVCDGNKFMGQMCLIGESQLGGTCSPVLIAIFNEIDGRGPDPLGTQELFWRQAGTRLESALKLATY